MTISGSPAMMVNAAASLTGASGFASGGVGAADYHSTATRVGAGDAEMEAGYR